MKIIKITQCHTGRFNLLSNEESFSFYASIYEDDKIIEENGLKAQIHYSSNSDESETFKDLNNLDYIFDACFEYSGKVISSTDYMGNCLFFGKVYQENYDEINNNLLAKRNEEIQKKIEKLQSILKKTVVCPDLTDNINYAIETEIKECHKKAGWYEKDMAELKEDSEKYKKSSEYRDRYHVKIEKLKSFLIPEILE